MTLGDLLEFHKDSCEIDIMQNSLFAHVTSSPFTGLLTSYNSVDDRNTWVYFKVASGIVKLSLQSVGSAARFVRPGNITTDLKELGQKAIEATLNDA